MILFLQLFSLTLGLFYPFINVLILKMVDWILFSHFEINGLWMSFLISILISIMNEVVNEYIIKPLLKEE